MSKNRGRDEKIFFGCLFSFHGWMGKCIKKCLINKKLFVNIWSLSDPLFIFLKFFNIFLFNFYIFNLIYCWIFNLCEFFQFLKALKFYLNKIHQFIIFQQISTIIANLTNSNFQKNQTLVKKFNYNFPYRHFKILNITTKSFP
jgi:hypothetical protein